MPRTEKYFPGGVKPGAPARNMAELLDSGAGTYTRWDEMGALIETRPLTADESAALAAEEVASRAEANGRTLEDRLRTLLARNAGFLALAAPTAAERNTQVERLTRQCSALIRLALRDLGGVD